MAGDLTIPDLRAITIRQPHASLVAYEVKTVETRPRHSNYRGPLAIHAGLGDTFMAGTYGRGHIDDSDALWRLAPNAWDPDSTEPGYEVIGTAPLGAIVAVANLVDCLPIGLHGGDHVRPCLGGELWAYRSGVAADVSDQIPYGDFTPGRWALLLEGVVRLPEPVPARGQQAVPWRVPPEAIAQVREQLREGRS